MAQDQRPPTLLRGQPTEISMPKTWRIKYQIASAKIRTVFYFTTSLYQSIILHNNIISGKGSIMLCFLEDYYSFVLQ
jgi:hypothetical protein